jgi:hypothetical protein
MKLTPYQKVCRYVNLAKVSQGLDGHGFQPHIDSLSAAIDDHVQLIASHTATASRSRICERLKYVDSHLCLCSYWMLIAGPLFQPRGDDFGSWNWPLMDMEFDHQGRFDQIPVNQIFYSGGESKFSFNCTSTLLNIIANYLVHSEAQKQLESRFKCIDGILNLGFFKSALYTGKVYVPNIPIRDAITRSVEKLEVRRYRNLEHAIDGDPTLQLQEIRFLLRVETSSTKQGL